MKCENEDKSYSEDQSITFLIVKSSQKIKFLNKYIEGLKTEIEETTEKYDKLTLKFRDTWKDNENLKALRDVLQA